LKRFKPRNCSAIVVLLSRRNSASLASLPNPNVPKMNRVAVILLRRESVRLRQNPIGIEFTTLIGFAHLISWKKYYRCPSNCSTKSSKEIDTGLASPVHGKPFRFVPVIPLEPTDAQPAVPPTTGASLAVAAQLKRCVPTSLSEERFRVAGPDTSPCRARFQPRAGVRGIPRS
jgi:hypothetical protein